MLKVWMLFPERCFPASSAGSNGHEFMFLLKGHEDLRQDERVMQLFGLVNTLLANDPASLRKNLRYASTRIRRIDAEFTAFETGNCQMQQTSVCVFGIKLTKTRAVHAGYFMIWNLCCSAASISIQRYAVIPLSTNSGLIGWVPHCDTLHALIRDYREKKKILLNIEHRIMLRVRGGLDPPRRSCSDPHLISANGTTSYQ